MGRTRRADTLSWGRDVRPTPRRIRVQAETDLLAARVVVGVVDGPTQLVSPREQVPQPRWSRDGKELFYRALSMTVLRYLTRQFVGSEPGYCSRHAGRFPAFVSVGTLF